MKRSFIFFHLFFVNENNLQVLVFYFEEVEKLLTGELDLSLLLITLMVLKEVFRGD